MFEGARIARGAGPWFLQMANEKGIALGSLFIFFADAISALNYLQ